VAVAEPDLTSVFMRCWQGSQRVPVAAPLPGAKKTTH
jgi:hypothetical protein